MLQERYTPGPWKAEGRLISNEHPLGINNAIAVAVNPADARLIAEAPTMFALIKQGLDLDNNEERQCPCPLCEAGRAIVARVLGE